MNIFEKFPKDNKCPICNTNKNGKCILIPVWGTQDGNNIEAEIFHLDCINLIYDKKHNLLYQKF